MVITFPFFIYICHTHHLIPLPLTKPYLTGLPVKPSACPRCELFKHPFFFLQRLAFETAEINSRSTPRQWYVRMLSSKATLPSARVLWLRFFSWAGIHT